ncbi:hypothetical protein [Solicola sp. PLA-1-18]|uniref:hypothetical protein n=1 Tax=Solicola sp. PLA-1-18 TaxID=3380532 RepID=UPI003B76E387
MNQTEVPQLLRDATEDILVGPPPVETIVRNGTRAKRRRAAALAASAAVTVAVFTAIAAAPSVLTAGDLDSGVATTPNGTVTITQDDASVSPPSPSRFLLGDGLTATDVHEAITPLKDCPELMAFLLSPEVAEMQKTL